VFRKDSCQVFHEENGLVMSTQMSSNRMYIIYALVIVPMCLKASSMNETKLWHGIYMDT